MSRTIIDARGTTKLGTALAEAAEPEPLGTYEFSEEENQIVQSLGGKLKLVGVLLVSIGVLLLLFAVLTVARGNLALLGLPATILLISGALAIKPASALSQIATTEGNDLNFLFLALMQMRKLFAFWGYLLIGVILFDVIIVVLPMVLAMRR